MGPGFGRMCNNHIGFHKGYIRSFYRNSCCILLSRIVLIVFHKMHSGFGLGLDLRIGSLRIHNSSSNHHIRSDSYVWVLVGVLVGGALGFGGLFRWEFSFLLYFINDTSQVFFLG